MSQQLMDEYIRLLKKYIDGMRWLEHRSKAGLDTSKDEEDFSRLVADPMRRAWKSLTENEQRDCLKLNNLIEAFNARIV